MKLSKLNDKIKFVKKALKTPYHFFSVTPNKQITVFLEDKQGKRYTFTGNSIFNSVETAEEYVEHEIEAGAIKITTEENKEEENKEEENEEKTD